MSKSLLIKSRAAGKKWFVLSACVVALYACSKKSTPTTTTETTTTTPQETVTITATPEELAKGELLVEQKCVKCHPSPVPNKHSKEEWDKVLVPMFNKAGVTDEAERKLIHDYVYANL